MQIHVEVVMEGQRERQRIATIQRSADLAAVDGLGLTLADPDDEAIRDLSRAREDAFNSRTQARH